MNTSDSITGSHPDKPNLGGREEKLEDLKENVTEALSGARQQADVQFGEYRDTAADQIEALAKGAKSIVSELESKDTLGMSDYLADMAKSMSGLAGNLRGKSAEQLFHDGADLARSNPTLFIAGSIALGFGLSRFLKAGNSSATTYADEHDPGAGNSMPPSGGFGAQRPYETSVPSRTDQGSRLASDVTPASPNTQVLPSDITTNSTPGSTSAKGAL
ncbi:hypothetical protein [Pseudomonas sp. NA-150]|uniref:hypothetical protein n=1 Tax=Pseudomonas sp. NA-150 TaxID=3367525 RepID=UPI0037C8AC38